MNEIWNRDRSIMLSRILVYVFAAAVLAVDIYGPILCGNLSILFPKSSETALLVILYTGSLAAYGILYGMHVLLLNIQKGDIFVSRNVSLMRFISYGCFLAAVICLIGSFQIPLLLVVMVAAAFIGLIVRIVKNVFQQAIAMKDELDFTV